MKQITATALLCAGVVLEARGEPPEDGIFRREMEDGEQVVDDGPQHRAHGDEGVVRERDAAVGGRFLEDEFTGELGKTITSVARIVRPESFVIEIHDMSSGEQGAKVIEVVYTRTP